VQHRENLQLIIASQINLLRQHFVTHSSPICPHQQTTGAEVAGGCSNLYRPLCST